MTGTFLELANGGDLGRSLDQVHLHERILIVEEETFLKGRHPKIGGKYHLGLFKL